MPLALTYRFTALNGTDQTLAANAVKVKARRWKFTSAGALSIEGSETTDNGSTVTNGSYVSSSAVDNSSNLFVGGDFYFEATAPASSNGDVTLYYERSTDGGSTWATNGLGTIISVLNFTTSGTKGRGFSIT